MKNVQAIILAAGEGVRMKSKLPKVLHKVFDKPMIEYVYKEAANAGINDICIVLGHKGDIVKDAVNLNATYVTQKEQKGTGHAVMCATDYILEDSNIIILYGDIPLIKAKTLSELISVHNYSRCSATVISAQVIDPTGYGRIIRDEDGTFNKIVEQKDANPSELLVREINSGIYCFKSSSLLFALKNLTNNNVAGEFYLTDCLSILRGNGENVGVLPISNCNEILGVNDRVSLSAANYIMRDYINTNHMINGVTIVDPSQTFIGPDVSIGCDSVIYPQCFLEGTTKIGEDCIIGPNCKIVNSVIEDKVSILQSIVLDSFVGAQTRVGPFAYIRPNCTIGKNAKIGDFVEVKNSVFGDGSKASHLTYVGDSDVGANVNFGCGTVTVNYDGVNKYRTTISDNVFIGCNTNLIAPVTVAESAYTAAGSTITDDVPGNTLAIARARQVIKKDWSIRK